MESCIGIDVSKLTLDACLLAPGKEQGVWFKVPNDPAGFAKLVRWARFYAGETALRFCLEATGAYSRLVSMYFSENGLPVSVVNPYRSHHAAKALGKVNKTDPVDAQTLALYCQRFDPPLWEPARPHYRLLAALMRRMESLQVMLQSEDNRRREPGLPEVVARSIEQGVANFKEQISRLKQEVERLVKEHPDLKKQTELLVSIPGIGEQTAHWLLAELPDLADFKNAKSAAAFAGLAPTRYESGTSVKRCAHISKRGSSHLRRALYMPALTAVRCNPVCEELYSRLLEKGHARLSGLCAVMRKLVMLAYGILKSGTAFVAPAKEEAAAPVAA